MIVTASHSFGTAEASAFADQLGASRATAAVVTALERCAEDPQPNVAVGAEALVAAEVVAASLGQPSAWLPAPVVEWLSDDPPLFDGSTINLALRAVGSVFSDDSELCGFGYRDVGAAWGESVTDLRRRLGGLTDQGRSATRTSSR
ncbi:MAG: DUF4259 domain-containing protein [Acidimicrobiia bacterium]|nr:DUF4259 domain-containing protein [Acidimicrobiia bacterium]